MPGRASSAPRTRQPKAAGAPPAARKSASRRSSRKGGINFSVVALQAAAGAAAIAVAVHYSGTADVINLAIQYRDAVLAFVEANPILTALGVSNAVLAVLAIRFWAEPRGGLFKALKNTVMGAVVNMPGVKGAVDAEMEGMMKQFEEDMTKHTRGEPSFRALPEEGLTKGTVIKAIEDAAKADEPHWSTGKLSGAVYHGGGGLSTIISEAISKFALSNPLHPSNFPHVRKMDAEVVSMVLSMFHGGDKAVGTSTSGGTESILLACLAYRDRARKERGVTEPEMIIPDTAHAAFNKAGHYFGIRVVSLPVDQDTFRVDPDDVRAALTRNTVMIVGSAPNFPQGTVDPIPELAKIAREAGVGLHVDCCLGSLLVPFAREMGRDIPEFDFAVKGVTSISCDTHKYGYSPKGSSVIMWADADWRHSQYYAYTGWTGGIYATPTIAGSRPGANLAATWAVMVHMGMSGYRDAAKRVFDAADTVTEGIKGIEGIEQYGATDHAVVAFGPDRSGASGPAVNIYKVAAAMGGRGWELNALQHPPSAHLCVTYANAPMAKEFVRDLTECVAAVRERPEDFKGGAAAMYGATTAMAPEGMLEEVAGIYLDSMYKA